MYVILCRKHSCLHGGYREVPKYQPLRYLMYRTEAVDTDPPYLMYLATIPIVRTYDTYLQHTLMKHCRAITTASLHRVAPALLLALPVMMVLKRPSRLLLTKIISARHMLVLSSLNRLPLLIAPTVMSSLANTHAGSSLHPAFRSIAF